jgi:hypothetical protein
MDKNIMPEKLWVFLQNFQDSDNFWHLQNYFPKGNLVEQVHGPWTGSTTALVHGFTASLN